MAHPDLLTAFDAPQDGVRAGYVELGESVLAAHPLLDHAAQQVGDELLAIADAQNGDAGQKQRWIDGGAAGVVNTGRAARDDDTFTACERRGRGFAGSHFGIHAELAHLAGNEVTVLPPGV